MKPFCVKEQYANNDFVSPFRYFRCSSGTLRLVKRNFKKKKYINFTPTHFLHTNLFAHTHTNFATPYKF